MRKFVVVITLLYTAVAVAALGLMSDGFREQLTLGESPIAMTLVFSLPAVLLVAAVAWWRDNEWIAVVLVAIMLAAGGYVVKRHHDAYGAWLPSLETAEVETSGSAVLDAHGGSIRYRLELHNPGTLAHREYLVVTRGEETRRIRLPLFGEARSGYVSAKTPGDWIVLRPTDDPDVFIAETGRFLFVRKSFRVNLQQGKVLAASTLPAP